jgi:hypothetical protein
VKHTIVIAGVGRRCASTVGDIRTSGRRRGWCWCLCLWCSCWGWYWCRCLLPTSGEQLLHAREPVRWVLRALRLEEIEHGCRLRIVPAELCGVGRVLQTQFHLFQTSLHRRQRIIGRCRCGGGLWRWYMSGRLFGLLECALSAFCASCGDQAIDLRLRQQLLAVARRCSTRRLIRNRLGYGFWCLSSCFVHLSSFRRAPPQRRPHSRVGSTNPVDGCRQCVGAKECGEMFRSLRTALPQPSTPHVPSAMRSSQSLCARALGRGSRS